MGLSGARWSEEIPSGLEEWLCIMISSQPSPLLLTPNVPHKYLVENLYSNSMLIGLGPS